MAVQVIFFKPKGFGSIHDNGVGEIRKREAITIPGATTETAQDGEAVVVLNEESAAVLVAYGSNPSATATTATTSTSAGYPVPAAQVSPPILLKTGDKVHVADVP